MTRNRPETTLFTLVSVDGKISTGDTDILDTDTDFPRIEGVREGLRQYYALEKLTDRCSLNTGKTMAKIGVNEREHEPKKMSVSFVIVDSKPHLSKRGVEYLAKWVKKLYLVTSNANHPAFSSQAENLEILLYSGGVDFDDLFSRLATEHGIERMTIQSGGTLNAVLLRKNLVDHVSIVVAPCLIGGAGTPTLVDGESLHTVDELKNIRALKLCKCEVLDDSYLRVTYDVVAS